MIEQSLNKEKSLDPAFRKDELQFVLAEYKTISAESHARMEHRVTLLTSQMATLGILFGLALNTLNDSSHYEYGNKILLLIPLISCLFGLLTTYHTAIIYDMEDYLSLIEARINEVHKFAMGWHSSSSKNQFSRVFWMAHLPMILISTAPCFVSFLLFLLSKPGIDISTITLLLIDIALIIYFLFEYLGKICKRKTYRRETTRLWAMKLKNHSLIPDENKFN